MVNVVSVYYFNAFLTHLIKHSHYTVILNILILCKIKFFNLTFQVITVMVWTACILYSAPKFYWGNTVTVSTEKGTETVCVLNRQKYNSKLFDIVHFVLLYLIPLTIISVSMCVVLEYIFYNFVHQNRKLQGDNKQKFLLMYHISAPVCKDSNLPLEKF